MNGAAIPGSLPEGAVERSETEGVYFGERKRSKYQSQQWLTDNHWPGTTIGRHSLSHALAGVPAPSEREPGGVRTFTRPPVNRNVSGDFHRPYEGSEEFTFYHSTDYTPSELVAMLQGQ